MTADLLDIRLVKREVKAWLASNVPKEWGRERVVLSYRSAKAIGQIGNVKWEFGIFSNRDEGVNCTMRAGEYSVILIRILMAVHAGVVLCQVYGLFGPHLKCRSG